jgi:hypothetical protein
MHRVRCKYPNRRYDLSYGIQFPGEIDEWLNDMVIEPGVPKVQLVVEMARRQASAADRQSYAQPFKTGYGAFAQHGLAPSAERSMRMALKFSGTSASRFEN